MQEVYGIGAPSLDDDDGLAEHVERCNELLKDIKSQCKANPNYLWEVNLADLLNQFNFNPDVYGDRQDVSLARAIRTAILELLVLRLRKSLQNGKSDSSLEIHDLEINAKLGTKLSETDSQGLSLLNSASTKLQTDDVAVLLANGAEWPESGGEFWEPLIEVLKWFDQAGHLIGAREVCDLLAFHEYAKEHGNGEFWVLKTDHSGAELPLIGEECQLRDLGTARASWLPKVESTTECHAWIDARSSNVCATVILDSFRT